MYNYKKIIDYSHLQVFLSDNGYSVGDIDVLRSVFTSDRVRVGVRVIRMLTIW